jgi:tRNA modification GTPase
VALTSDTDTIVAIATAPGRGGVGIIRLSGASAKTIAERIVNKTLSPRYAHFSQFTTTGGRNIDSGITLFFSAPNSFTGEDIVELQAHGGPVILDMLVRECCTLGARPARPGEFSERAFLNDKIDLAQAEAIADLINSSTEQAALNASESLQGAFSKRIDSLVAEVIKLRVFVEAAIDFPEEEIDFIQDGQVATQLSHLILLLDELYLEARQGALIQEGVKVVIAGKPNAGKSSLLNALAGRDTAIVTPIEGTTRDLLREHIQIDGIPIHIVDTAGLRESIDVVEREGIRRARKEMQLADRVLLVVDDSQQAADSDISLLWSEQEATENKNTPVTIVRNKIDLSGNAAALLLESSVPEVYVSTQSGAGMDLLRDHLKKSMGFVEISEGKFSARRRHLQSLERAYQALKVGQDQLLGYGAGELLAEDLRLCQQHLGEITGAVSSDDLLGEIFSNFCIGK